MTASRHLDLNLLKVFLVLWDERSVSGAARRCNVTQSAMSHSLKRLRAMLGDELFVRGAGRQLAPSPTAISLEPRLRKALWQVESAVAPVEFDPAVSNRRLVVAAGSYNCEILLPSVIAALKKEAPSVTLQIVPLGPGLHLQMDSGAVDLAFGAFDNWGADVDGISLFREDMVWIARRGHSLVGNVTEAGVRAAGRVEVSSRGISTNYESVTGVQPRTTLRPLDAAIAASPPTNPFPAAEVVVYDNRTAMEVVSTTDLVAMVPRRVAERYAAIFGVEILELGSVPASSSISMIWHRHHSRASDHTWFREVVARCAISVWNRPETGILPPH